MAKLINEIGNKYGNLLVLEKVKKENNTHAFYKCQCDCGNIIIISGTQLRKNKYQKIFSCGCLKTTKKKFKEWMSNQRFGKLLAISPDYTRKSHEKYWLCKCQCGNIISTQEKNLLRGKSS